MLNIEELLRELVKYSRETNDYAKVDKMVRVVAGQIEREMRDRQIIAITAQMNMVETMIGGNA
jgi:ferritin